MTSETNNKQHGTPLDLMCAQEAHEICEFLDHDLRDMADCCHNNNGHRTYEDWEKMDKYLLGVADKVRRLGKLVDFLSVCTNGRRSDDGQQT